jgi:hypothetical protein
MNLAQKTAWVLGLVLGLSGLANVNKANADEPVAPTPNYSSSFLSRQTQQFDPTTGVPVFSENVQLGSASSGGGATTFAIDAFGILLTGGTSDPSGVLGGLGSIVNPEPQPEPPVQPN